MNQDKKIQRILTLQYLALQVIEDRKKIQRILTLQYLALQVIEDRISEDKALKYAEEFNPYEFINHRRIESLLRVDESEREIVKERIRTLKSR